MQCNKTLMITPHGGFSGTTVNYESLTTFFKYTCKIYLLKYNILLENHERKDSA